LIAFMMGILLLDATASSSAQIVFVLLSLG